MDSARGCLPEGLSAWPVADPTSLHDIGCFAWFTVADPIALSKLLAYGLRHRPDALGVTLDAHGWARLDDVLAGVRARRGFGDVTVAEVEALARGGGRGPWSGGSESVVVILSDGRGGQATSSLWALSTSLGLSSCLVS